MFCVSLCLLCSSNLNLISCTGKIMKAMSEVIARPIDLAAVQLKGADATLSKLLNLLEAVILSYRFSYKDAKKFAYVRSAVVDQLALVLLELVDAEAARTGLDPAKLSPEQAQAIVDSIVGRVNTELTARSAQMTEALKSSPLFASGVASQAQAAAAAQVQAGAGGAVGAAAGAAVAVGNIDVDAGIGMLMGFLRDMVSARLDEVTKELSAVLGLLTSIALKYRGSVLAASVSASASGSDPDAMPADYQAGVKKELLEAIEGKYTEMENKVAAFVRGILKLAEDDE